MGKVLNQRGEWSERTENFILQPIGSAIPLASTNNTLLIGSGTGLRILPVVAAIRFSYKLDNWLQVS